MIAKPLRGIHVFWMVFVFFAIVITVDTTFIVRAVNTFPGEQVANSYVLGLEYNAEVARRVKQSELGWQSEIGLRGAKGDRLIVRMKSRSGEPITGLLVAAEVHQAGKDDDDRPVQLVESAAGEYSAQVQLARPSHVELNVAARRPTDHEPVFEAQKSLVIS